jgi:hypothetical protein
MWNPFGTENLGQRYSRLHFGFSQVIAKSGTFIAKRQIAKHLGDVLTLKSISLLTYFCFKRNCLFLLLMRTNSMKLQTLMLIGWKVPSAA